MCVTSEKGYLNGVQHIYKKYVTKLEKDDPDCPLCHRPFDDQADVRELIQEVGGCLFVSLVQEYHCFGVNKPPQ